MGSTTSRISSRNRALQREIKMSHCMQVQAILTSMVLIQSVTGPKKLLTHHSTV
jgi:hypothetical protein